MVQVINDEFNGNVFGRLGKGIGKGLSEQLPKEIERSRLSSGLKKFEEESKGLTPVQQFTRLAAIPGITPEHLYTLTPLLRQQQARDEGNNIGKGEASRPQPSQNAAQSSALTPTQADSFTGAAEKASQKRPLKSLEATQAQLTPIVQRSPQELFSEAALLSQQNPSTYPTPADALPFVQANESSRIANLEEQRAVGNTADVINQRLRTSLGNYWGKENTQKGIPGTVQTKLANNVENDLADPNNKLSEQQLITKWGEVGKRIAKAQTNLDARSRLGWFSSGLGLAGLPLINKATGYTPEKIMDTIDSTRKVYEEADALEEFQDLIASKFDLSPEGSAYIAYPPKNTEANKYVKNLKLPSTEKAGFDYPQQLTRASIDAADNISKYLSDDDSILSYAVALKKKGLDPSAFFRRIKQNMDSGLFEADPRQREEIARGLSSLPPLGDLYLFSLTNQDKLVE